MPEPWEMTEEEARLTGERLRERLLEADRIAAPRFLEQLATLEDQAGTEPLHEAGTSHEEAPDEAAPSTPRPHSGQGAKKR